MATKRSIKAAFKDPANGVRYQEIVVDRVLKGLALHKKIDGLGTPVGGWVITHVPTGYALGNVSKRGKGREIIRLLGEACDWEMVEGAIPDYMRSQVRALMPNDPED